MKDFKIYFDLHTHTISSGHGSTDTINDLARTASQRGLSALGISDHGPATTGSASASYFKGLRLADKKRFGVEMFYGVELNILDMDGAVDLDDSVVSGLDYAIISIHPPIFNPWEHRDLTDAYLAAMDHPRVKFLGHIDDARFPSDYERLLSEAKRRDIFPEINNLSLAPDAYRVDGPFNCPRILRTCRNLDLPVLLSSDSHGMANIGNIDYIRPLLQECSFPTELILNCDPGFLRTLVQTK